MRGALLRASLAAAWALCADAAPCDIFASGGTPCVAAHSVVRALYAGYNGPLYSVNRTRDGARMDVRTLQAGGYADSAAQDAFCAPPAPAPPPALPALGSVVTLAPAGLPGYSFRHCDAQGFVTPDELGNADHLFTLVAALSGAPFPAAVSFRSVNFPAWYVSRVAGAEPGRLGIAQAPAAADASWAVAAAAGGAGFTLALAGAGFAAVGGNCTGSCARNYAPPAASVYLAAQPTPWRVAAPPGPPACTIAALYDQSPRGNHLLVGPAGGNGGADRPVDAARLRVTAGGNPVYAAYFEGGGQGYRRDNTSGVATGNDPETLYMVTSGTHFNCGCCFDCACGAAAQPQAVRRHRAKLQPPVCQLPPVRPRCLARLPRLARASADGNAETNNNDDGAGSALHFIHHLPDACALPCWLPACARACTAARRAALRPRAAAHRTPPSPVRSQLWRLCTSAAGTPNTTAVGVAAEVTMEQRKPALGRCLIWRTACGRAARPTPSTRLSSRLNLSSQWPWSKAGPTALR